jgi:hypothetical protein
VSIPGLLVAGVPLLVYDMLRASPAWLLALPVMAVIALFELAGVLPFALSVARRGAV